MTISVTDLELLTEVKKIDLWQISFSLPTWISYFVTPVILLLIHFIVLRNIWEHRQKFDELYQSWVESHPDRDTNGGRSWLEEMTHCGTELN